MLIKQAYKQHAGCKIHHIFRKTSSDSILTITAYLPNVCCTAVVIVVVAAAAVTANPLIEKSFPNKMSTQGGTDLCF